MVSLFEEQAAVDAGIDPAFLPHHDADEMILQCPATMLAELVERWPHLADRVVELRKADLT
jgi:hypothetical protein